MAPFTQTGRRPGRSRAERSRRDSGADTLSPVRVLVVTNFVPDDSAPQRGRWVDDQIEEVRRAGRRGRIVRLPARQGRVPTRRPGDCAALLRRERFDLVHAHYGLPGWCAQLAGARPLVVTFHGTDVRHGVVGPLSRRLAWRADSDRRRLARPVCSRGRPTRTAPRPRRGGPPLRRRPRAASGPDLARRSRAALGLDPDGRYLLFPADPARPEKRHDRAVALARACGAELLSGGAIDPDQMALWINAANAVLVTSEYEGFGLACVEALACDVPVLSTPVGIAPYALGGIEGCLCAPFDVAAWSAAAAPPPGGRRPPCRRRRAAPPPSPPRGWPSG